MTLPPAAPHRRSDDDRIDTLKDHVATLATNIALLTQQVVGITKLADRVEAMTATMQAQSSDLSASPAGRETLRRLEAHGRQLAGHQNDIEDLNTFRTEVRSFVRFSKALLAVLGAVSTILGIIVALHAIGRF